MSEYPRCATCKHFRPYVKQDISLPGIGVADFGPCLLLEQGVEGEIQVYGMHTEVDVLVFRTFGCVLHESADANPQ